MSNPIRTKVFSALSLICLIYCASGSIAAAAAPASTKKVNASVLKLGVTVELGNLAKTSHTKVLPRVANVFDDIPFMNGEPEHLEVTFDNDKPDDFANGWQRKIVVYPLTQYAQLFKGKEKNEFNKTIASLKSIIAKRSADGVKALPMLPAIDCYELFHNHAHILDCKNGTGVAFITCYGQDEGPLKNGDFFYTYQGISSDGRYYVSFTFPIKASKLKDNTEPKAGKKLISELKDSDFTPNLNEVDKMIQSITIK